MATSSSFLPNTDTELLGWAQNFSSLITSAPTSFGLTAALATAFTTLTTSYATALAACDPSVRTKSAVATKNSARTALKADARLLAKLVDGTASVTNAQKLSLGLNVPAKPSPIPAPSSSPAIQVKSVNAWTVKIKLTDLVSGATRGKPAGVSGAAVFTYVGEAPPTDIGSWQFEGNTGRVLVDVVFPNTTPKGSQVWITAFWFNGRKQSGPACSPVGVILQGGGVATEGGMALAA